MTNNRILPLLIGLLIAAMSESCSSARKIAQSSTEQHITASQSEDRHVESHNKEAVNLSQNINENTNAVIEFTKVEFNDGTCETETPNRAGDSTTPKPRNRESKKPPNNHGGIKSITTGRINFNNNRNATTEAGITTEDKTQSDESIDTTHDEDNGTEIKTDEKPIRGTPYHLCAVTGAIVAVISLCIIVRRLRRRLSRND